METLTYFAILGSLYFGALGLTYLFRLGFDLVEKIREHNARRVIIHTKRK